MSQPSVQITRYLEFEIRSRYDKEIVRDLLWMMYYRQRGVIVSRNLTRLVMSAIMAFGLVTLVPTRTPSKWYGMGLAVIVLIPVMSWLLLTTRRISHAHQAIWDTNPPQ